MDVFRQFKVLGSSESNKSLTRKLIKGIPPLTQFEKLNSICKPHKQFISVVGMRSLADNNTRLA
jgi:hypothetical protein